LQVAHEQASSLDRAVAHINEGPFTPARVTTMTLEAKLSAEGLCKMTLLLLVGLIDDDDPDGFSQMPQRKKAGHFFNQVTIRHGKRSIKIFMNGTLHITGCKSIPEALEVAALACRFVHRVLVGESAPRVVSFRVDMINMNFSVGTRLQLVQLQGECHAQGLRASYDPDIYPGLNIKLPVDDGGDDGAATTTKPVTANVFKSGSVLLSGAKTGAHLCGAYGELCRVLETYRLAQNKIAALSTSPPPPPCPA
jgi:TATA-box binding protein (TBP) (component of TFIID and TFIIIB)